MESTVQEINMSIGWVRKANHRDFSRKVFEQYAKIKTRAFPKVTNKALAGDYRESLMSSLYIGWETFGGILWQMMEPQEIPKKEGFGREHLQQRKVQ
jgi:hypothetical protein